MTAQNKEKPELARTVVCGAKGLAVGIITAAALLFIFTAIAYSSSDPDSLTAPLGYAALYLSAAAAGIAASRICGDNGAGSAIAGGMAGLMLLFTVIIISLIPADLQGEPLSPITSVLMGAAIPAAAALGGFILRKRKSRKIRHRHRR